MATSSLVYSTPSPPGTVRTPGTPKHGYSDAWVPFSPRKSARISSRQQSSNRTPSPRSSQPCTRSSTKSSTHFSTPSTTPPKKRLPAMDSVRRASNTLTAEGTANAADSLGIASMQQKSQGALATTHSTAMLPTPAKTPRKQPNANLESASRDIARNIFATDTGIMPSPKKKAKKYTGLTLDSFKEEDADEPIEIFTDSRDRIPEVDNSAENPFYGDHPTSAEPPKRRSKRKTVVVPGDGRQTIEDAVRRDDGVLVVFRGKKIFRKFSECNEANSSSQAEGGDESNLDGSDQPRRRRPMTRSSIKPRLLFPPSAKGKEVAITTEDEEAATDIDDHVLHNDEVEEPQTPQAPKPRAETPDAPRFAPASPPSTGRVTRSADKLQKAKVPSPFDSWRRSKTRSSLQGQKREGEPLTKSPAGAKRQRS
ncbi:hypothetical protein GGS21DRAFT_248445 [Xylaria nigripes]|nr:hypothetical protein GGS21DRAFT_248445 [Xylaria nigripes]